MTSLILRTMPLPPRF